MEPFSRFRRPEKGRETKGREGDKKGGGDTRKNLPPCRRSSSRWSDKGNSKAWTRKRERNHRVVVRILLHDKPAVLEDGPVVSPRRPRNMDPELPVLLLGQEPAEELASDSVGSCSADRLRGGNTALQDGRAAFAENQPCKGAGERE